VQVDEKIKSHLGWLTVTYDALKSSDPDCVVKFISIFPKWKGMMYKTE